MANHFSLIMSCIDSVSDRVRGGSSRRWQLNEHQCSYLAEELLKVSRSLQAKIESGKFKPVQRIQKIVLLHLHAAVKRAQLLVERCCCETSASWRVSAMTSTDIKEEVISTVLNLHQWTSVLDIAIASVEGRPSKEKLEFLKTGEEGYQRLFKKLHLSKHPLQVAALQDQKTLLENIAEYTKVDYAYGVYLKSRLAPMGGEVQSVPQLKHYKISRELGQGASGMVLEVTWMGRQYGLKISKGSDETEATILDRLHHPNIVRFFHYWEVPPPDRKSYMVMELLPSDLQKHILRELSRPSSQSHKKRVRMPFILSVAIDLMFQVAQAMQHVHDQKLTHRDLKTSNILVKPVLESMSELHSQGYLEVKLADFGLAKGYIASSISEGLTRNMGTTIYGAPEIFGQEETQTHKNFPPKSDVWSFGMVCWEILTGRMPFSEERSKAELHKRIRFEGLRPSFPKDCPGYLQFCIASCWELQPQRRPSFSDLCRMLRHAQLLNLGLICLEDTGTWFGYSDRAGLMNTMSMTSTSSEMDSTKSWFPGGLISNFRNKGRGSKLKQPTVEDSNDHTLQPTCDIGITMNDCILAVRDEKQELWEGNGGTSSLTTFLATSTETGFSDYNSATSRFCTPPREPSRICTPPREPIRICTPPRKPNRIRTPPRKPIRICMPPCEPSRICTPPREPSRIRTPPRKPIRIWTPPRERSRIWTPPHMFVDQDQTVMALSDLEVRASKIIDSAKSRQKPGDPGLFAHMTEDAVRRAARARATSSILHPSRPGGTEPVASAGVNVNTDSSSNLHSSSTGEIRLANHRGRFRKPAQLPQPTWSHPKKYQVSPEVSSDTPGTLSLRSSVDSGLSALPLETRSPYHSRSPNDAYSGDPPASFPVPQGLTLRSFGSLGFRVTPDSWIALWIALRVG